MLDESQDTPDDNNWDDRVLCPDESCIGTIGPDGRCRECGLALDRKMAAADVSTEENQEPTQAAAEDDIAEFASDDLDRTIENETDTTPDWDNRTLCRDESCIGTIGPSGRCNVCGLTYNVKETAHDG